MKLIAIAVSLGLTAVAAGMPIIVFNEDDSHFFDDGASRETLQAYIDTFASGGRVTHFFMCPNAMRANFDSRTFEPVWKSMEEPGVKVSSWARSLKRLYDGGIDPYAVWIARCREKGISPWITMRMNDVHGVTDPSYCSLSTFWRRHPELRRVPESKSKDWSHYAFDFSHREVREHHLAFVKELFDRYDMDGFETDWLRFYWHLTPGKELEQSRYLTEFMRDVRKIARAAESRRGHRILVGARVASTPKVALALGTDAIEWAKKGLVDWIVPCNFWTTVDFDLPIDDWQRQVAAANPSVMVIPGLDIGVRMFRNRRMLTAAECRGWAELQYARGAKGVYLFNYFSPPMFDYVQSGCFDMSHIADLPRAYPVSYRDTALSVADSGRQVPTSCGKTTAEVRIPIGCPPTQGMATVLLAFDAAVSNVFEAVRLNGVELMSVKSVPAEKWLAPKEDVGASFECRFPVEALVSGTNIVSVAPLGGLCKLLACELIIEPITESPTRGGCSRSIPQILIMGTPNLSDSLCVVKQFVFDERRCAMSELVAALAADWNGHEALREEIARHGKFYGNIRHLNATKRRIVMRCPMIPGINDDDTELAALGKLADELEMVEELNVEPYVPYGVDKSRRLGLMVYEAPQPPPEYGAAIVAKLSALTPKPVWLP